jgi:hypothetical protein
MLLKAFLEIGCVAGIMFRACGDVCQNIYIEEGHKGNRNICCIVRIQCFADACPSSPAGAFFWVGVGVARLRPLGRFFWVVSVLPVFARWCVFFCGCLCCPSSCFALRWCVFLAVSVLPVFARWCVFFGGVGVARLRPLVRFFWWCRCCPSSPAGAGYAVAFFLQAKKMVVY